jgi:hypothetical protein
VIVGTSVLVGVGKGVSVAVGCGEKVGVKVGTTSVTSALVGLGVKLSSAGVVETGADDGSTPQAVRLILMSNIKLKMLGSTFIKSPLNKESVITLQ